MSNAEQHVDSRNLRITGKHKVVPEPHFSVTDDVVIVVTQAFGPKGDNLVGISGVMFDGYPAVTLLVEADGKRGQVHLSPIHGDVRKEGFTDIAPGTKCKLFCPVSEQPLDKLEGPQDDGTCYFAMYLTPALDQGSIVAISDEWGHYHSRIVDNFELISDWAH